MIKHCNTILTEKKQKYQLYHQVKMVNMNSNVNNNNMNMNNMNKNMNNNMNIIQVKK